MQPPPTPPIPHTNPSSAATPSPPPPAPGAPAAPIIKPYKKKAPPPAAAVYGGVPPLLFGLDKIIEIGRRRGKPTFLFGRAPPAPPADDALVTRIFDAAKQSSRVL